VARYAGTKQNQVVGLAGILGLQVVTLVQDASTGGLGALLISVPGAVIFYGIGLFVQSRAAAPAVEPAVTFAHVNA
jgi:hypothetical protein